MAVNLENTLFMKHLRQRQARLAQQQAQDQGAMGYASQASQGIQGMQQRAHEQEVQTAQQEGVVAAGTGQQVASYEDPRVQRRAELGAGQQRMQQLVAAARAKQAQEASRQKALADYLTKRSLQQQKDAAAMERAELGEGGAQARFEQTQAYRDRALGLREKGLDIQRNRLALEKQQREQKLAEDETRKLTRYGTLIAAFTRATPKNIMGQIVPEYEGQAETLRLSADEVIMKLNERLKVNPSDTAARMLQQGISPQEVQQRAREIEQQGGPEVADPNEMVDVDPLDQELDAIIGGME